MNNRKLAAGAAGLALIAVGGAAAVGASGATAPDTAVIKQKTSFKFKPNRYIQDGLRFDKDVYTVKSGGKLKVVLTVADEGPHTVSLVKRRDIPKTPDTLFNCKACNALAKAHGADPESDAPPKFKYVENGKGQKTPSEFDRPGDSAVTSEKKGSSFSVDVTAPAGSTRYFMCIIHPWMQAKLEVK